MDLHFETIILVFSVLIVIGILIYNPAKFLGIPSLIIFMGIGLFLGNGGLGDPSYDDPELTDFISTMALNIIIFAGGFQSRWSNIKLAWKEGLVLSTIGVLLTAFVMGGFTYLITGLPLIIAMLFGAIVSSTDAASVFSILKAKKLNLKHHTDTILELESATNDPMAMVLVMVLTQIAVANGETSFTLFHYIMMFLSNITIGVVIGVVLGWLVRFALSKINFREVGLIPVFLLLGLQIFTNQLPEVLLMGLVLGFVLIFVARPAGVLLCYLPFLKVPWNKRLFISAIGLKGATPIVFAFIPLVAKVPHAQTLFNMVFFVVILSILLQGTTLGPLAKKMSLTKE